MVEFGAGLLLIICGVALLAGAGAAVGVDVMPLIGAGGAAGVVVVGLLLAASGLVRRTIARDPTGTSALRAARLTVVGVIAVALLGLLLPLAVETLNLIRIAGMPAGYYIAAEGAPVALVIVAFVWAMRQSRIDGSAPEKRGQSDA